VIINEHRRSSKFPFILLDFNHLTPNDHYTSMGRTAQLTSRRCI